MFAEQNRAALIVERPELLQIRHDVISLSRPWNLFSSPMSSGWMSLFLRLDNLSLLDDIYSPSEALSSSYICICVTPTSPSALGKVAVLDGYGTAFLTALM